MPCEQQECNSGCCAAECWCCSCPAPAILLPLATGCLWPLLNNAGSTNFVLLHMLCPAHTFCCLARRVGLVNSRATHKNPAIKYLYCVYVPHASKIRWQRDSSTSLKSCQLLAAPSINTTWCTCTCLAAKYLLIILIRYSNMSKYCTLLYRTL
jgi:hypothetical protein